jgi:imidazolonepropionase-like amidohydrolase
VVATVAEARQIVRTIKASGVDFVKVYTELRPDEYFAIADEARKENIPFAGHVPYRIDAGEASDAGQRSIEHLTNILESCSTKEQKWLHSEKWDFGNDREMLDSYDDSKCRRLFSKFAKNNTWQVPTLILHLRRTATDVSKLPNDLPLKYLPAETREQPGWKMYMARQSSISQEEREVSQRKWAAILKIVREMHEAGVQFMTGTDVDNPYVYPGFSLHDELALLVEAGLTPAEALRTATLNPTRYLGLQKDLGTIAEDNFADLVLLEANPLDDIHNTRKITAVVLNGMYLNRADLDRILAGAGNQ